MRPRPPALQPALPKERYVDHGAWLEERERVLHRGWFCVGREDDLGLDRPGRLVVVDVVGESVLLARDDRGLHASYNVCRHRGAQLRPALPGDDPVPSSATALRCPYHSWTYALDGRLLRAPHTEGVGPDEFSLHPVTVAVWEGFVLAHLTPSEAGPLGDVVRAADGALARYAMGRLVTARTMRYDVAANYKVLLENFNECYHCGPVHPELTRLVPAFGSGGRDLDWDAGVPHRPGAWTFTTTGTTVRRALPGLTPEEATRHKGALVYPNLMLSACADHVAAYVLLPQAPARTRVECRLLFDPEEMARDGFDPSDAADLWDLVNRQDWAICESVQRGMSSRAYRQGWFAPMEDESLDIRRWLTERLGCLEPP
jgi:Rieske 2Fe-2S family protein